MWIWFVGISSILSATAIGFGAFGAHALKGRLTPEDAAIFETATKYLTTQSLGLFLVALLMSRFDSLSLKIAASAMTMGIVIFSGSLFVLIATGQRWWGAITPIGGLLLIGAWLLCAWSALSVQWS